MSREVNYVGREFYHDLYGRYEVIKDLGLIHRTKGGRLTRLLRIRFDNTGYETNVVPAGLESVKDPYYPNVLGIAWFGEPIGYDPHNNKHVRIYTVWTCMLYRCYDPRDKMYYAYGGIGVKVCDRWHCFANFFEDIQKMENYDKICDGTRAYEFDKDYLQQDVPPEQRIYSPETCCIIPKQLNGNLAQKARSNINPYIGVEPLNGNYRTKLFANGSKTSVINAIFSDAESAAIYRDSIAKFVYGYIPANGFDLTAENFQNACKNRIYNNKPYEWKQLYRVIDKNNKEQ